MRYTDELILETLRQPVRVISEANDDYVYRMEVPPDQIDIKLVNIPEHIFDIIVDDHGPVIMEYRLDFEVRSWGVKDITLVLNKISQFGITYNVTEDKDAEGAIDKEIIESLTKPRFGISLDKIPASAMSFDWTFTIDYTTGAITNIDAR